MTPAARSHKHIGEVQSARRRLDLEEKARAYVLELQKRPEVQNWNGQFLAFAVMFELGPIDIIRFNGERWTYSYRVATKGIVRSMGAILCDKAKGFEVDITPAQIQENSQ